MTVYFIGAGPGDPELITVKGQRLIRQCPVVIYAGSLVPAAVLEGHQAETVINSAELHLEQIIAAMRSAHEQGQDVARVHSGDPSLYGAIGEQIRHLQALGAVLLVIPHVIGAPQPEVHESLAPEALETQFKMASWLTNAAFWVALGLLSAWLFRRSSKA